MSHRLTADREEMKERQWTHMCERALNFVENSVGCGSLMAPAGHVSSGSSLDQHVVEVLRDGVHLCDLAASFDRTGGNRSAVQKSKTPMGAHRQTLENIDR